MNVEVVQKKLWEQSQQHREHRLSDSPLFPVNQYDGRVRNLFRPNRSTHHAVLRCQQMLQKRFTWIIEGDVKACFDEISHEAILGCLREKVMDNRFLALIHRLLKAGVNIDGVVHPTEKGVPQGGIVSPLLSNMVLNKLDWFTPSGSVSEHCAADMISPRPSASVDIDAVTA